MARVGGIVEPLRDGLVRLVVRCTLTRSAAAATAPDRAAVARLCRHVEIVRDVTGGLVVVVAQFVVTGTAMLVGISSLAPQAAWLVGGPLAVAVLVFACLLPPMAARQRALLHGEERLTDAASLAFGAISDIVTSGAERAVAAETISLVRTQARIGQSLATFAALRRLAVAVGVYLPMALLLLEARALGRHGLTGGALVGMMVYLLVSLQPAVQGLIEAGGNSVQRLSAALSRIAEMSDVTAEGPGPIRMAPASALPRGVRTDDAVAFRGVTFRYGPAAAPVVRDLSFTIAPGTHLAVVGPSGAGKSTLAGLMSGLLHPDRGEILLGGRPLAGMPGPELYRLRTLIPQEAYVFAGTLRENIGYLRPGATSADIASALARLGMEELTERFGGMDACLTADTVSAGERQLIALARAYVAQAPLTVLDEAACHLDRVAEARVEQAFRERPGTVVIIAHRISSARRADLILLMDGATVGSTLPPATHQDLLGRSPLYASLVAEWEGTRPVEEPPSAVMTWSRKTPSQCE
jgi:ATP-binding cassette, subfamily C, bacterial